VILTCNELLDRKTFFPQLKQKVPDFFFVSMASDTRSLSRESLARYKGVVKSLRTAEKWADCGYLYIVNNKDWREGKLKFGKTERISKRLESYDSGNAEDVDCVHLVICLEMSKAENSLKKKVRELGYCYRKKSNEWVKMGAESVGSGVARLIELMHTFLSRNALLSSECGTDIYDAIVPDEPDSLVAPSTLLVPTVPTVPTVVMSLAKESVFIKVESPAMEENIRKFKGLNFVIAPAFDSTSGRVGPEFDPRKQFRRDPLPPRNVQRDAQLDPWSETAGSDKVKRKQIVKATAAVDQETNGASFGISTQSSPLDELTVKKSRKINRVRIPTAFTSPMVGVRFLAEGSRWEGTNCFGKRASFAIRKHGDKGGLDKAVAHCLGKTVAETTSDISVATVSSSVGSSASMIEDEDADQSSLDE
jgi:hypothetical protein